MRGHGRRHSRATHIDNTSVAQDEQTRKSYHLRKRKCETEQDVQDESLVNESAKRRCLRNDDQRKKTQHEIPPKGQNIQHTKIDTLKEKRPQACIQKKEAFLKQPFAKSIKRELQAKKLRRLTPLSKKKEPNSKRKISDSNPPLLQKKTQVKGEQLSKMKLTKTDKDRRQRTLHGTPKPGKKGILQGTPKPMLASKAPGKEIISNTSNPKHKARKQSKARILKNSNQTKEAQLHSNIQQTTEAKHLRISNPKMMKQKSTTTARKVATKNNDPVFTTRGMSPKKDFSSLFLERIDAKFHPEASLTSSIYGLSISHDNLIWVNHLRECVQLLNSSGEVLRTIDLDHSPVFNCCTPSGDLLETQGNAKGVGKSVITLISRDGSIRVLADLSSYAAKLYGILCENETIFVVGCSNKADNHDIFKRYIIMKLSLSGEVEGVYNTKKEFDEINHIIALNGQIIVLRSNGSAMIPLKDEIISSEEVNKVLIDKVNSASASVDNLGNVILGSNTELVIIDPSLEFMHRIDTGIGNIISTAVDKNNQLWLGTASGKLYSAQYLK